MLEEGKEGVGRGGKISKAGRRSEEGAGEGFVERRDSDEHERFARPDVEMVGRNSERAGGGIRGNKELAPKRVDVFLLVVDAGELHHVVTCRRVRTIRANKDVERNRYLGGAVLMLFARILLGGVLSMIIFGSTRALFEPGNVFVEVGASQLVIEVESDVWHSSQIVKETLVQSCSVHRADELIWKSMLGHSAGLRRDVLGHAHRTPGILDIARQIAFGHVSFGHASVLFLRGQLR